jgi:hypothetical protein
MKCGISSEQFERLERFERFEPAPAIVQSVQAGQIVKSGSLFPAGAVI